MKNLSNIMHIAPCGMNCSLCIAFQREKKKCPGCNGPDDVNKPGHCIECSIKLCENMNHAESHFCYSCIKFPCRRLKQLDIRYKTKYGMSMIQNLEKIKTSGMNKFITGEIQKWTCRKCGSFLCVHKEACQVCGTKNKAFPHNAHPGKKV